MKKNSTKNYYDKFYKKNNFLTKMYGKKKCMKKKMYENV